MKNLIDKYFLGPKVSMRKDYTNWDVNVKSERISLMIATDDHDGQDEEDDETDER